MRPRCEGVRSWAMTFGVPWGERLRIASVAGSWEWEWPPAPGHWRQRWWSTGGPLGCSERLEGAWRKLRKPTGRVGNGPRFCRRRLRLPGARRDAPDEREGVLRRDAASTALRQMDGLVTSKKDRLLRTGYPKDAVAFECYDESLSISSLFALPNASLKMHAS